MEMDRRQFLKAAGLGAAALSLPSWSHMAVAAMDREKADYTLHIRRAAIELAPGHVVTTTTYNGQFPGPLLRFHAGRRTVVDIYNETGVPEQLHWHGQRVPASVDGSSEEGTPFIPAHGHRREIFVPGPAGMRFYHTHIRAGSNLNAGQYTGQVGIAYIESRHSPGDYDREVFLVMKEFEPSLSRGGDMDQHFLVPANTVKSLKDHGEAAMKASLARGMPKGYEVGYKLFSINGRMLGHGEPVRVKPGERVLFHVLNGSATEIRSLALPGHTFRVVALDGNPVPTQAEVPVLWLGTAERVSAIVEMNRPGVWVMGDLDDDDRRHGMGIVVEYAGRRGTPQWVKPRPFHWDYRRFADPHRPTIEPDRIIEMTFRKRNAAAHGFNLWTINGKPFSMHTRTPMFDIHAGKRYRLRLRNASDDIHPVHLHRHLFELTRIAGHPTAGVMKDVAMLGGYQEMEVDFLADNPGLTLFHCHQQLHMDYGFMALFRYV